MCFLKVEIRQKWLRRKQKYRNPVQNYLKMSEENNENDFEDQTNCENININDNFLKYTDGIKTYSADSSLDYSPVGSVFESEDCYASFFENDESGVESVDGDWLQSCNTPPSEYDLDLTEEQAMETLKYFSKCSLYWCVKSMFFLNILTV